MSLKKLKLALMLVLWVFSARICAQEIFSEKSFRLGYYTKSFQDHSYEDLEVAIKMLAEEMGKQQGIETHIMIYDDISQMREAFSEGLINSVLATAIDLVQNFDEKLFAADGYKFIKSREAYDSIVVATRKNEDLDDVKSFRGKRLTLQEYSPIADIYMSILSLRNYNKNPKGVFDIQKRVKRSNQAILELFFGKTDVICIYKSYYNLAIDLNPQLNEKLQIIDEVNNLPQAIGFFNINTPADFRELIISEMSKIKTMPRGKQLLELIKVDSAERANVLELNETKKLISEYQKLTINNSNSK